MFGGAVCFDRKKVWLESQTDMEAFLLSMRLHLIHQMEARLEKEPSSDATSSSPSRAESSYSAEERANGFNHIMRTHWDWNLVVCKSAA